MCVTSQAVVLQFETSTLGGVNAANCNHSKLSGCSSKQRARTSCFNVVTLEADGAILTHRAQRATKSCGAEHVDTVTSLLRWKTERCLRDATE